MKLHPHQEKYASGYKDYELVVHEGGSGKTICAIVWLQDGRDDDALVICPKRVVKKWQKELEKWGATATVVSKEDFKKMDHKPWSAIVVDEADEFASPLFIAKKRSQLTTHLYNCIRLENHETPRLLLTATPIRSHPWNLHTLLTLKGHVIDWKKWRERFFSLQSRPYLPGKAWLPRNDWRTGVRKVLKKYADIVLLKDIVDLPKETTSTVKVSAPKFTPTEWEPAKRFYEEHRNEQKNKARAIKKIGKEYRKVLVVAQYREQCEALKEQLSKDRETFLVYGGTKNQEDILRTANEESDECYLIVQASLGAGFDADSFSCVVFASMSYSVRDYSQMKYRVRRIHNLHPVHYYHLLAGRCDRSVWGRIQQGKSFVPSEWCKIYEDEL